MSRPAPKHRPYPKTTRRLREHFGLDLVMHQARSKTAAMRRAKNALKEYGFAYDRSAKCWALDLSYGGGVGWVYVVIKADEGGFAFIHGIENPWASSGWEGDD
jgi:hypothetical protein